MATKLFTYRKPYGESDSNDTTSTKKGSVFTYRKPYGFSEDYKNELQQAESTYRQGERNLYTTPKQIVPATVKTDSYTSSKVPSLDFNKFGMDMEGLDAKVANRQEQLKSEPAGIWERVNTTDALFPMKNMNQPGYIITGTDPKTQDVKSVTVIGETRDKYFYRDDNLQLQSVLKNDPYETIKLNFGEPSAAQKERERQTLIKDIKNAQENRMYAEKEKQQFQSKPVWEQFLGRTVDVASQGLTGKTNIPEIKSNVPGLNIASSALGFFGGLISPSPMVPGGGSVGSIASKVGMSTEQALAEKVPSMLKTAANTGATFGTIGAFQAEGTAQTPEEALKTIGSNVAFGLAAGPVSKLAQSAGESLLSRTPDILKNSVVADIVNKFTAGGVGGAAGALASSQVNKPGELPDVEEIMNGAAINALFHGIPGTFETITNAQANKAMVKGMEGAVPETALMKIATARDLPDSSPKIEYYKSAQSDLIIARDTLNKQRFVGSNKELKAIDEVLNYGIENIGFEINRIRANMGEPVQGLGQPSARSKGTTTGATNATSSMVPNSMTRSDANIGVNTVESLPSPSLNTGAFVPPQNPFLNMVKKLPPLELPKPQRELPKAQQGIEKQPDMIGSFGGDASPLSGKVLPNQTKKNDAFDSVFGIDTPSSNARAEYNSEIDNRTFEGVGDRKIKSIQQIKPELAPHIQKEAQRLLTELKESQKGKRIPVKDEDGYIVGYRGENRVTSKSIERMLDNMQSKAPTYDELKLALEKIIRDGGAENNALSKRIELIIDDNLSNGTTDIAGIKLPANQDYINLKNQISDAGKMVGNDNNVTTKAESETTMPATKGLPQGVVNVHKDINVKIDNTVKNGGKKYYAITDKGFIYGESPDIVIRKINKIGAEPKTYENGKKEEISPIEKTGKEAYNGIKDNSSNNPKYSRRRDNAREENQAGNNGSKESGKIRPFIELRNIRERSTFGGQTETEKEIIRSGSETFNVRIGTYSRGDGEVEGINDTENPGTIYIADKTENGQTATYLHESFHDLSVRFKVEYFYYFKDVLDKIANNPEYETIRNNFANQFETGYRDYLLEKPSRIANELIANEFSNMYLQTINFDNSKRFYTGISDEDILDLRGDFRSFMLAIRGKIPEKAIKYLPSYSHIKPAKPFFSKLQQVIEDKMPNKADKDLVFNLISKNGVKHDEVKWSGINDFMKGKERVDKKELLEFLKMNELQIEEIEKVKDATIKYSKEDRAYLEHLSARSQKRVLQLMDLIMFGYEKIDPNIQSDVLLLISESKWEKIRELLGKIDNKDVSSKGLSLVSELENAESETDKIVQKYPKPDKPKYDSYQLPGGENYRELLFQLPITKEEIESDKDYFASQHWDELNILAHVRLNDRVDAQGNKILFVEEIQSDWHQEGRKKGYKREVPHDVQQRYEEALAKLKIEQEKFIKLRDDVDAHGTLQYNEQKQIMLKAERDYEKVRDEEYLKYAKGIPDAPFQKTWHEYALKRLIRYAAENGYDKIAWTTGDMQNKRYKLTNVVNTITYERYKDHITIIGKEGNRQVFSVIVDQTGKIIDASSSIGAVEGKTLEEVLGRDIANKIMQNEGKVSFYDVYKQNEEYVVKDTTTGEIIRKEKFKPEAKAYAEMLNADSSEKHLTSVNLEIGGSGMKGFYDKIIPDFLNQYGKRWQAKVGESKLTDIMEKSDKWEVFDPRNGRVLKIFDTELEAKEYVNSLPKDERIFADYLNETGAKVQSFPITESMKKSVMSEGQPMFSKSKKGKDEVLQGTIIPGAKEFLEHDIIPKTKDAIELAIATYKSFINTFTPKVGVEKKALDEIMTWKGKLDKAISKMDIQMYEIKKMFDKLGKEKSIEFIDNYKRNLPQATPELQAIDKLYRKLDDITYRQLKQYKPGLSYKENHFRVMWKVIPGKPEKKGFLGVSKRPLEGTRGWQKHSTLTDISEGIQKGGEPYSYNPQTLFELAHIDALKYITVQEMWKALKGMGLIKFVKVGKKSPEGFTTIDDRKTRVYIDPHVKIQEAFDEKLVTDLNNLVEDLGLNHLRKVKLGRAGVWGWASRDGKIVTKFAGPETVLTHELGHQIDFKYHIWDRIKQYNDPKIGHNLKEELRALSDLRYEGKNPDDSFKKYVRKGTEQAANLVHAYIHAPELLKKVAPLCSDALNDIIFENPELAPLKDIKPSLVLGTRGDKVYAGGNVQAGTWYVEENVARLLNNYLSKDYIRDTPLGSLLMSIKNATTALELSISPFHAVFETLESVSSQIGLGITRVWNQGILQGDPKALGKGLLDIVTSPTAFIFDATTGGRVIKFIKNEQQFLNTAGGQKFIKRFPQAAEIINDLFTGGGKLAMHEDYKIKMLTSFTEALNSNNYLGALMRLIPAANIQLMRPLFEIYIPRLKVGIFFKEYSQQLEENAQQISNGKLTKPELARRTWDSVENRFGEMNFDNLFWTRTFKTALQFMFRSVTWKLGNVRGFGGGVAGQLKYLVEAIKGKRVPKIHPQFAWLLGLGLLTATMSTILMKTLSGDYPKEFIDYFFPKTGDKDKNGNDLRIAMPTYIKDLFSLQREPVHYVTSSFSGMMSKTIEAMNNRDFYGNFIYDPGAPTYEKFYDSIINIVPMPFAVNNYKELTQNTKQSMATKILGVFAFVKAPRDYIITPFQKELAKVYESQMGSKSLTPEQQEVNSLKREIKDKITQKTLTGEELLKAINDKVITEKGLKTFLENTNLSPLQIQWKYLKNDSKLGLIGLASENELRQLIQVEASRKKPSEQSILVFILLANMLKLKQKGDEQAIKEFKKKIALIELD